MKNSKKISVIICSLLFIFILVNILLNNISNFDENVYSLIIKGKNSTLTNIFRVITELGGIIFTIVLCVISTLICKKKGFFFVINVVSVVIINNIIKFIAQRPRPEGFRLIKETGYSFPSGHSMNACAIYGFFIYLILKSKLNNKLKIILTSLFSIIILLIMVSRVYLGVHYASDVIAGLLLSIIWLLIYTEYLDNKKIYD